MVQLSMIAIVLTTVLSGMVSAKDKCGKVGSVYCGDGLLSRGDFGPAMRTALRAHQPSLEPTERNVLESLWECSGGGQIRLLEVCVGVCIGNPQDKVADVCGVKPGTVANKRDVPVAFSA